MTVPKCTKTVAYAIATLLMTGFATWIAAPMYSSEEMVTAYLRSVMLLFIAACGILGVGAYSFIAYTRRHREHRGESWFLLAVGSVVMLATIVVICRFGGMSEDNFSADSYVAINFNLMLVGVLPLPFLVRAIIAATGVCGKIPRMVAWAFVVAAAAVIVALAATGHLLNTVKAVETASFKTV